jgi:PPOX class probable F420-dependent enzyme
MLARPSRIRLVGGAELTAPPSTGACRPGRADVPGGGDVREGRGMTALPDFARLAERARGLCVVSTLTAGGRIQSTLVNAGVLEHPVSGVPVVGLVARGTSRKVANLRARPRATVSVHAGPEWATVEGPVTIAGPDDALPGVEGDALRLLLRQVFTAAGGTHDDWDHYDATMAAERRAAVLVTPDRVYSNG